MRRFAAFAVVLVPGIAAAGSLHRDEFPATIVSAEKVAGYELTDPFAGGLDVPEAEWPVLRHPDVPVCRVTLSVDHSFFRRASPVVFAAPELCAKLRKGDEVKVEYYGLAHMYRFVGLELAGVWHELPLMRETKAKDFTACFAGRDVAGFEDCAKLVHRTAP